MNRDISVLNQYGIQTILERKEQIYRQFYNFRSAFITYVECASLFLGTHYYFHSFVIFLSHFVLPYGAAAPVFHALGEGSVQARTIHRYLESIWQPWGIRRIL
jgi:hypothetical protein